MACHPDAPFTPAQEERLRDIVREELAKAGAGFIQMALAAATSRQSRKDARHPANSGVVA